jgi:hypothetical protein
MLEKAALSFNGTVIRDRNEMLSLTDMWRAQGADAARQPAEWLRSADAIRFIGYVTETLNLGISQDDAVKTIRGGKTPGTWAHWQIGLAYAKYLSPEFHMWCNTVVRERMEHKPAAPLAMHEMSAEFRKIIGGIVKSVVHAELSSVVPQIANQVLPLAVAGYLAEHSLAITDGLTAGEVCNLSKVASSYPRGVAGKVSSRMARFCEHRGVRPPVARLGRVRAKVFPTNLARDWLDMEGRSLIRRWVAEAQGQKVLHLVPQLRPSVS